ncbi:hypothetical protein NOS3756_46440 [Nostoc sp. NIES-3756]|nr:hypothetical protein NOS3756_46440 [Nostoc sp. NIES-3756]
MWFDPPKSPLKRGTLILVPPFLRGVRGDRNALLQLYKTFVYTVAWQGEGWGGVYLIYLQNAVYQVRLIANDMLALVGNR